MKQTKMVWLMRLSWRRQKTSTAGVGARAASTARYMGVKRLTRTDLYWYSRSIGRVHSRCRSNRVNGKGGGSSGPLGQAGRIRLVCWTGGLVVQRGGAQLRGCSGGCDASRARIGGEEWSSTVRQKMKKCPGPWFKTGLSICGVVVLQDGDPEGCGQRPRMVYRSI